MAREEKKIERKLWFHPGFWISVARVAVEKMKEKKQTKRRKKTTEKEKIREKKFWYQPTFWIWIVMATLIVVFVPKLIAGWIAEIVSMVFPLTLSWLGVEILLFLGLLVLWTWPKKYMRQILLAWLVIGVLITIKRPTVILPEVPWLLTVLWAAAEVLVCLVLGFWLKKCLRQIGTIEVPSQAVLARFAKPVDAVGPGLYFCFFPFETFKECPTGQYEFEYTITKGLYSKEDKKEKLASQPIEVRVVMYLRFPKVDRRYKFPERARLKGEKEAPWKDVAGRELLVNHIYPRLPVKDLKAEDAAVRIGEHFEGGVISGLRHVLAWKNSRQCKEDIEDIEAEVKMYLLQEEGNAIFECGIPKECLSIELAMVKLPDETEKAYIKPELKKKDAEAAKHEETAIRRTVRGFTSAGVSTDVAGVVAGAKIKGEPMDLGQLRDLHLALGIQQFLAGQQKETETKK